MKAHEQADMMSGGVEWQATSIPPGVESVLSVLSSSAVVLDSDETSRLVRALRRRTAAQPEAA